MLNTDRLCMGCMNDNSGQSVCPICGYDSANKNGNDRLPIKFTLAERYLIGRELFSNTESITYIAFDTVENSSVTIREYFPHGFAVRKADRTVYVSEGKSFAFNKGLMQFIELNNKLVGTEELPCINPILYVFEENGTAYAVSSVLSGITLSEFLERNGGSLRWEQTRSLVLPLFDTLKALHEMGIVHGAVSPETVIVCRDGKLRLNDIAISEIRCCDGEFAPTLYSGYSAPEQYGVNGLTLGEYTDVYGLCATLFKVIIGSVPPAANDRMNKDALAVPAKFANELPRQVLVALANGLQLMPGNRTPDIDSFKNELVYGEVNDKKKTVASDKEAGNPDNTEKSEMSTGKSVLLSAAITTAVCAVIFLIVLFATGTFKKDNSSVNSRVNSQASEMPSTDNVGDFDPDAVKEQIQTYGVSDYRGKTLAEVVEDEANENFKFVIKGDAHSDKYKKGVIISQSISAGTVQQKETVIEVVISSGPEKVKLKSVLGCTKDEAVIELLKQGLAYDNIIFVGKYDPNAAPSVVIEQSVKSGTTVSIYDSITLYYNEYEGDEEPQSDDYLY